MWCLLHASTRAPGRHSSSFDRGRNQTVSSQWSVQTKVQFFNVMGRVLPKQRGFWLPLPGFCRQGNSVKGIFLDAVRQGVKGPPADIFAPGICLYLYIRGVSFRRDGTFAYDVHKYMHYEYYCCIMRTPCIMKGTYNENTAVQSCELTSRCSKLDRPQRLLTNSVFNPSRMW